MQTNCSEKLVSQLSLGNTEVIDSLEVTCQRRRGEEDCGIEFPHRRERFTVMIPEPATSVLKVVWLRTCG
ncbi:hypothetical protein SKAU_G00161070 [Synaphobranchus kaupii]|uniref:Uncharacterized protein n=1 Tax=Synaphobranchus kaupii TaxID=118154 RepID=A0A9Q1IZW6_SYNKA|nr:hypothetical protein SKAU_G00161070 [Synaphobranchus kaupii]